MPNDHAMSKEFVTSKGKALSQGEALTNGNALSNETAENALANALTKESGENAGNGAQVPSSRIALSQATPTVTTDKADYAPGETVEITLEHVRPGTSYSFQIVDAPADPGDDGDADVYPAFSVVDGGAGDLDGVANGKIITEWTVPTDGSPVNATLNLTVTDAAGNVVATTTFTDAGPVIGSGASVVLDETTGLQNATATPTPTGDANDNDTNLTLPSAFSTRLTTVLNATTATETEIGRALSGYNGANTGLNAFTLSFAPGATSFDVAFVGSDGQPLSGLDSGIDTLTGLNIYLYTDGTNNNILLGRVGNANGTANATGTIAFAAYIEETGGTPPTGGKIWLTQYQALNHSPLANGSTPDDADNFLSLLNKVYIGTSENLEFSLANAPSGQNLFLMFTTGNPSTFVDGQGVTRISGPTIIATGKDPANQSGADPNSTADDISITTGDTINTSQAGGPTTFGTNNQMIVEGEGVRFTFVMGARQNVTIPNLDQNEADIESNIDFTGMFSARRADFDVVQLQSGKSAAVKVTAYTTGFEPGASFIDIDGYAGDTEVNISSIQVSFSAVIKKQTVQYTYVFNENGSVTQLAGPATSPSNFGLSASFNGNTVTISGVRAHYNIQYTTDADHNRILVENAGNGIGDTSADFDIGGFSLLQVGTATAEIGSKMIFEDDGPSIDINAKAVNVVLDESIATDGSVQNEGGAINNDETTSSDPTDIGYVTISAANLFTETASAGSDGQQSKVYALSLPGGSVSGLADAQTNEAITLSVNGTGTVVTGSSATGGTVFTITVDAATGAVTVAQFRAIEHNDSTDHDENGASAAGMGTGVVSLGVVLTDRDGDTANDSIDLGSLIKFEDDGPAVTANAAVQLDDEALTGGNAGGTGDVSPDTANLTGTLGHSFGADGGSIAYLTTGAPTGFTYELSGSDLLVKQGTTTVLTLTVNSATGAYTVTQNAPIQHAAWLDENNQAFTITYQVTDGDGDTANGTLAIDVDDDAPVISGTTNVAVDEEGLAGGNAGDSYASGDLAGEAITANGTLGVAFGADGAATTGAGFTLSATGASWDATTRTLTGADDAWTVVVAVDGSYTFTLLKPLTHATANTEDDAVITVNFDATDKDGDVKSGSFTVTVDDDAPVISGKTDLIYANSSNPTPGGTGVFAYDIGADARTTFSSSNSDFSPVTLSGTVGTTAITGQSVTWASEDSTTAVFNVQFNYQANPSSPTTTPASGTLTFDKVYDTYTLSLTQPISGFSIVNTAGAGATFTGYQLNSSTTTNSQPPVTVASLAGGLYVQFSSYKADNQNPLYTSPTGVGDPAYSNGDLINGLTSWVSASGAAIGVAGDTVDDKEVLDLDLFTANPQGFTNTSSSAQASGIYLKFDNIGSQEDLIVILKLIDTSNNTSTTKALYISNSDIIKVGPGDSVPKPGPGIYSGVMLDNNDGLVIIEQNDYATNSNQVIQGVQIITNELNLTGPAIDLNPAIGAGGGSNLTPSVSFSSDVNGLGLKISDIGFVTTNSGQLNTNLSFDVALKDADGDSTATQTLNVAINGGTTFTGTAAAESIQGTSGNDTINGGAGNDILTGGLGNDVFDFNLVSESQAGANKDVITDFVSGTDKIDLAGIDAITGGSDNAFTYITTGAFTSSAGQLRFDVATNTLQGDTDGNGVADVEIQLVGINSVAASDLVL